MKLNMGTLKRILGKAIRKEPLDEEPAEIRAEAARLFQEALDGTRTGDHPGEPSDHCTQKPSPRERLFDMSSKDTSKPKLKTMTISGPTGSGKSTTLDKAMAAVETEDQIRRSALKRALQQRPFPRTNDVAPRTEREMLAAWVDEISFLLDRLESRLATHFRNRHHLTEDEVQDALTEISPLPTERRVADQTRSRFEEILSAWRKEKNGRDTAT